MKEIGIYIHIPFCVTKCKYCDFNSYAGHERFFNQYVVALTKEIAENREKYENCKISTIFIGGGTPSCVPQGVIATILAEIKNNYDVLENAEITIECNPNSVTYSKALEWFMAGVNRVSVGLQTSRNNLLRLIGRTHNKQDYINAINTIKSVGFTNINTDLMLGLPKQKMSDIKKSITLAKAVGSKHISLYSLILEENTQLFNEVSSGFIKLPSEKKVVGMMLQSNKLLELHGFKRYEVSNYSIPGFECKHNINCWKMVNYVGFGAGAHSYFENERWSNVCEIEKYIKQMQSNCEAIDSIEQLKKQDLIEEHIMLGLRLIEGVDIKKINELTGFDIIKERKEELEQLTKLQLVVLDGNKLKTTEQGFLFLNKIIEMLI